MKNTNEKLRKFKHHFQVNNGSKIQGWNKGDVKHAGQDDKCFNKLFCSMCHWQDFSYAKLYPKCLPGKLYCVSFTYHRQKALHAFILPTYAIHLSNFPSKRYPSCCQSWSSFYKNEKQDGCVWLRALVSESDYIGARPLQSDTKKGQCHKSENIHHSGMQKSAKHMPLK